MVATVDLDSGHLPEVCLSDGQGPGVRVCLPRAGRSLYPSVSQQTCVAVNKSKTSSDIAMHVETAWNCTRFDNITYMYITDWIIYLD